LSIARGNDVNFEIEVTKWWVWYDEWPDQYRNHSEYDGRQLVLQGTASVNRNVYYQPVAAQLNGADCRIYLRPTLKEAIQPKETALWEQEQSGWRIYLYLNLERSLWEDLWRRTYHPLPKVSVNAWMDIEAESASDASVLSSRLVSVGISSLRSAT
jgi:hypothetical protein